MAARMVAQVMNIYLCRTRFPDLPNCFPSAWFKSSYLRLCAFSCNHATEAIQKPENAALLSNLSVLGVDIKMAQKRQPGVFRKVVTNEEGVAEFLRSKGANRKTIASVISRYPRVITRSYHHLEERWQLWRSIFKTDSEIISIIERSPESYFRSSDNENFEKNINFLYSLGLTSKDLRRILTAAPRALSNSLELNKQMAKHLRDLGVSLGIENPDDFVKRIMTKNAYILIRSTKRIKTNVDFFREALEPSNSELIKLLQGQGAEVLDLSTDYMKRNFKNISEQLYSLGCSTEEVQKFFLEYPPAFYASFEKLSYKIDCLLESEINIKQLLNKPRILEFSAINLKNRIKELERVGYDFTKHGVTILDSSRRRFEAKLGKLNKEE